MIQGLGFCQFFQGGEVKSEMAVYIILSSREKGGMGGTVSRIQTLGPSF